MTKAALATNEPNRSRTTKASREPLRAFLNNPDENMMSTAAFGRTTATFSQHSLEKHDYTSLRNIITESIRIRCFKKIDNIRF
jgi:hypothetical protein